MAAIASLNATGSEGDHQRRARVAQQFGRFLADTGHHRWPAAAGLGLRAGW